MFNISDKVVCVDDSNQTNPDIDKIDYVVKDAVYVIRGFDVLGGLHLTGMIAGYWIGEVSNSGLEAGWKTCRFRKLEDIKEENRLKNVCKSPNKEYIEL